MSILGRCTLGETRSDIADGVAREFVGFVS